MENGFGYLHEDGSRVLNMIIGLERKEREEEKMGAKEEMKKIVPKFCRIEFVRKPLISRL